MLTDCFRFLHTQGMGWMVAGTGLFWLLELGLLGLAAAALVKYLRGGRDLRQ
jgi:hypothetical protein